MLFPLEYPEGQVVDVLLFKEVKNAAEFRRRVLSGDLDVAALNAELIVEVFPLLVAVQDAVKKQTGGALVCKKFSAEVVYNISATKNIGKGLSQFGVADTSTAVLVVVHRDYMKTSAEDVTQAIEGIQVEDVRAGLDSVANSELIQEAYDITSIELQASDLLSSVVTRIAVRDIR